MRWLISIEKAKALKDAGLRWVAKGGDCYFYANGEFTGDFIIKSDPGEPVVRQMDCQIWLPRLDQLLTEIEKRRRSEAEVSRNVVSREVSRRQILCMSIPG